MPTKLSEPSEELFRQFIIDNTRSSEMQGYDPKQTDTTAADFLPVTKDWSEFGDYYPIVVVQPAGPTILGGGETGFTGVQGDGSGPNQYTLENVTVSVQATDDTTYRNSTDARPLIQDIYAEIHHQVQNNVTSAISEAQWATTSPGTTTTSQQETDSGSTVTWLQKQGQMGFAWLNEP